MDARADTRGRGAGATWTRLGVTLLIMTAGVGGVACGTANEQTHARPPSTATVFDRAATAQTRIVTVPHDEPAWLLAPDVVHDYPYLAGEPTDVSISVGDTSDGYLVRGRALPIGLYHQVLSVQFGRDLGYATDELIQAIVDAAAAVAQRYPGSITFLGNIGRHGGGDISWSVSHNNGRDADLAYFSANPFGWQTRPPNLLHFERDLRSQEHHGFYSFDVARNAELAKALVTVSTSAVQYLFTASYLKREMLAHYATDGTPEALVATMGKVLHQPRGALPHDDHLHIRVYCSTDDVCGGCQNTGVIRDWAPEHEATKQQCLERVARIASKDRSPEQRAAAVRRIALANAASFRGNIAAALDDREPLVRVAAVESLLPFGATATVQTLQQHFRDEQEPTVLCAMAKTLRAASRPGSVALLTKLLASGGSCEERGESVPVARVVAEALENTEDQEAVEPLLALLEHDQAAVRGAAAKALRKLTNRADQVAWERAELDASRLAEAHASWEEWYRRHRKQPRSKWLVSGFQDAGYTVPTLDSTGVRGLLEAMRGPEHISYNAQRSLMRIANKYPPSLSWSTDDAVWYWTRYFKKRQDEFGINLSDVPERGPAAVDP